MGITYEDEATLAPRITYEERRKPSPSGERLKHDSDSFLANLPDVPSELLEFATGGTGLLRGIANLPGKAIDAVRGKPQTQGAGDVMFPKAGDPESGWKTLGEIADPLAWAIAGGVPAAVLRVACAAAKSVGVLPMVCTAARRPASCWPFTPSGPK